ncbi:MAG: ABC transporter permease, partial [Sphingobacteriaceae bacterium]
MTNPPSTWALFKRNKFAVGGLAFIIFSVLVAVLGYLIIPDQTPQANNMVIQLSLKKPGASFKLLRIRKTEPVDTVNVIEKMLFGQPDFYRNIPITAYKHTRGIVYANEYIGDEDKPEPKAYRVNDNAASSWYVSQKTYLLGTDIYGRDMLSRLLLGTR